MSISNKHPYSKIYHLTKILDLLKPGDHIEVPFVNGLDKLYYHHAIYIGNEEFIEMNNTTPTIRKIRIEKLPSSSRMCIIDYSQTNEKVDPQKTMKRAYEKLQDPGEFSKYDPIHNNCEHFAHYCTTGRYDKFVVTRDSWKIPELTYKLF